MGGAVFSLFGKVTISNSTLAQNDAIGGFGGRVGAGADTPAGGSGDGLGGAVFNVDGSLSVSGSTIAGNSAARGSQGAAASTASRSETRSGAASATTASVSISGSILYGNTGAGAAEDDLALDRVKGLHHTQPQRLQAPGGEHHRGDRHGRRRERIGLADHRRSKARTIASPNGGSPATVQPGPGSPALAPADRVT